MTHCNLWIRSCMLIDSIMLEKVEAFICISYFLSCFFMIIDEDCSSWINLLFPLQRVQSLFEHSNNM